jgi:hypothetical protein
MSLRMAKGLTHLSKNKRSLVWKTKTFFVWGIITLFSSQNLYANNDFIFGCGPMGGAITDDTHISYALERTGVPVEPGNLPITYALRKTLVSEFDESTLEKTLYAPGFLFMEYEDGFEFAYIAKRGEKFDALLIGGKYKSKKTKDDLVVAEVAFLLEFQHTTSMFQKLMEPPDEAQTWQCLVNLKELRPFQVDEEQLNKKSQKKSLWPEVRNHFKTQSRLLPKAQK